MKLVARLLVLGLVVSVLSIVPASVRAGGATIVVDETADETTTDGDCSLREAVATANTDTSVDDCDEGNGADRIELPPETFLLQTGPLEISTNMQIEGAGKARTSIERSETAGNNPVIDSNPPNAFVLTDLTIANGSGATLGGGIHHGSGNLLLRRAIIRDNDAAEGAAIWTNSVVDIANSVFTGNVASGNGGAIYSSDTATISETTFDDNRATDGGGIYIASGGLALLTKSAFLANKATEWGGGIHAAGESTVIVENSTLSGNKATSSYAFPKGAGLFNAGDTTLSNVTVTKNQAKYEGSGIFSDGYVYTSLTINNTIISGNRKIDGTPGDNCVFLVDAENEGYNLENGTSCDFTSATDLPAANPRLGRLGRYGGPTKTHPLKPSSPAIDAGSPGTQATGTLCRASDQRSVPRPQDGPDRNSVARCDVGAFELRVLEHRRDLGLDLTGHLRAKGRLTVRDGFNRCRKRAKILIQEKGPNGWQTVADDRTTARGRYSTSLPDDAGAYRAITKQDKIVKGDVHVCLSTKSSTKDHRH